MASPADDSRLWGPRTILAVLAATWMTVAAPGLSAAADTPASGRFTYRGVAVEAVAGLYVVTQDANARETPDANGKRRDMVEEGTKVRAFAKAANGWLAVKLPEGRELGFLPANVLHGLFDGALDADVFGDIKLAGGRSCTYVIRFSGNSPVEGESFETSDYDVGWRCTFADTTREFSSFLFVTEAFEGRNKPLYQVTNDIWEISGDAQDQVFSTTMMYDQPRGRLTFDSVSIDSFAGGAPPPRTVSSLPELLRGAVELAAASWNAEAWNAIGGIAK